MRVVGLLCVLGAALAACPFKGNKLKFGGTMKETDCPHQLLSRVENGASAKGQVTASGCDCRTTCSASVSDAYDCDWCYTENGCGRSGLSGKWDYCVYPADRSYEAQTADQKLAYLWKQIDADHTNVEPVPSPLNLLKSSIQTTFDDHSDVMPAGRKKYIHSQGAVCKFSMEISADSPFTGVFKASNVARGLIRMGSALAVDMSSGVVPGLGIKFLRSNVPSGNFVALVDLAPLPDKSYNFFESRFSNHIPAASGVAAVLAQKFFQKSNCVTQVGLSDICKYDNDGASAGSVEFPYQVTLDSKQIQFPKTPVDQPTLQKMLAAIPSGTALFEVGYYADPKAAKSGAAPQKLGTMVTDGPCVNSKFGDSSLFFRHQLVEEDWEIEPTWPGYLDKKTDCSWQSSGSVPTTPPKQCANREASDLTATAPVSATAAAQEEAVAVL